MPPREIPRAGLRTHRPGPDPRATQDNEPMTERALIVTAHGGPEVLAVQPRPMPEPGPGELAVRVEAVGVNFIDVYYRNGSQR